MKFNNTVSLFFLTCVLMLVPFASFAQGIEVGSDPGGIDDSRDGSTLISLDNPIAVNSMQDVLVAIINIVMVFAIPIIVFYIIYAGFLYVTARGNPETIGKAHRALLYAIIGGVLILGAEALSLVIQGTVNDFRQ